MPTTVPSIIRVVLDDLGKTIDVTVGQTVQLTLPTYYGGGWDPLIVSRVAEPQVISTGVLGVVSMTNPPGGTLQATLSAVATGKVIIHADNQCPPAHACIIWYVDIDVVP